MTAMLLIPAVLVVVLVRHIHDQWPELNAFTLAEVEEHFSTDVPEGAALIWSNSGRYLKSDRDVAWVEWPTRAIPNLPRSSITDCSATSDCLSEAVKEAEKRGYTLTSCNSWSDGARYDVCVGSGEAGSSAFFSRFLDK